MSAPDAIKILQDTVGTKPFGDLADTALQLVKLDDESGNQTAVSAGSGAGMPSADIAKIWGIRTSLPNFPHDRWLGLETSIASLEAKNIPVSHLHIETSSAAILLWISSETGETRGLMITHGPSADQSKFSPE